MCFLLSYTEFPPFHTVRHTLLIKYWRQISCGDIKRIKHFCPDKLELLMESKQMRSGSSPEPGQRARALVRQRCSAVVLNFFILVSPDVLLQQITVMTQGSV